MTKLSRMTAVNLEPMKPLRVSLQGMHPSAKHLVL